MLVVMVIGKALGQIQVWSDDEVTQSLYLTGAHLPLLCEMFAVVGELHTNRFLKKCFQNILVVNNTILLPRFPFLGSWDQIGWPQNGYACSGGLVVERVLLRSWAPTR